MAEAEFQRVLKEALEERYADIPDPDELEYDYTFSPRFERRMKRMIRNFDRIRSKAQREAARAEAAQQNRRTIGRLDSERSMQYVTLGRYTMRRAVAIALVAALILALAACAIRFAIIWHETNNEKQGTLDVTFALEDPAGAAEAFAFKEPTVPEGYVRGEVFQAEDIYTIEFLDAENDKVIYYNQTAVLESTGLGIDNVKRESCNAISINGHKGYSAEEPTYSYIIWSDGVSSYRLTGSNISFRKNKRIEWKAFNRR